MGNRCYFDLVTDNEGLTLFEANNSLPFFWIGCLDKSILQDHEKTWKYYAELLEKGEDDFTLATEFIIEKSEFERNSERTANFLSRFFPKSLNLFLDFKNYITSEFEKEDDYLLMDVIQFAGFTSVEELLDNLYKEVEAIETDNPNSIQYLFEEDLIASGSGFSVCGFDKFSQNYPKALKNRTSISFNDPFDNYPFSLKSLITNIIMLLMCPIFTYAVYRGYLKEGFSTSVILIGLLNLGFYAFSLFMIFDELKNYFAQKS